jgi:hypothetical protein
MLTLSASGLVPTYPAFGNALQRVNVTLTEEILMKAFAIVVSALLLGACSSIGQKVASGINNSQLSGTVGKPYTQVMYEHPDFGKLIGRERLVNGNEIMKHVGDFGTATNDVGGLYGKRKQNARVTYFLVDSAGNVKDWASEFYQAGSATCWVGICAGAKNEQVPFEELDKIVKTSSGNTLDSWRMES